MGTDHQWLFILVLRGFPDSEDIADAIHNHFQICILHPADHLVSALLLGIGSGKTGSSSLLILTDRTQLIDSLQ